MFVSVLMVRVLLDECRARGLKAEALLAAVGLTADWLADGAHRMPAEDFERLALRALRDTHEPALGLALGARLPAQALQVVGYLLSSAPSMRHAYRDFERYAALLAETPRWDLREEGERAVFEFSCLIPRSDTQRMANDWSLSLAYRMIRTFAPAGCESGMRLSFAHAAPKDTEPYQRLFGAQVRFGASHNAVSFPRAWIDLVQPHGDAATCAGLRELAERMLGDIRQPKRLGDQLRLMLRQESQLGSVDVAELARRLGVSQSVLRRRLAAEGVSASQLMDEARCRVACAALSRTDRSLKQLADELGYAEPSSFHRAFKRWTGKTPADYRDGVS
ncbi:MAG TPA: AraC family transcriptional regulator [Polyangiales bacterium]